MIQNRKNFEPYCGYHQNWEGEHLADLTQTNAGTLCGEYLRRYWHPIYIAKHIGQQPKLIKVLGEELVIFKDRSGDYGLVHKKCPHRRASLEYGRCEHRGIRCCYHGWLFDIDGTILEIPGEPKGSLHAKHAMENLRIGAYPIREFKGLLFAYLGPPEQKPEFPIYDTYNIPGMIMTPYAIPFNCNWLQILDAILDPVHTAFLHHSQFSTGFGKLGEIKFYHRDNIRFLGTASRRVNDNIWVRVNELILPNFTQAGAAFSCDGTATRYFGRSSFTRWVVPLDDNRSIAYAWGNFGDRGDPETYNCDEGMQQIEHGELVDRPYEEKQRNPGDIEAVEGMGAISDHEKEYFLPNDHGVTMYRHQIRKLSRDLKNGGYPPQPTDLASGYIPTYGSDTVLNRPAQSTGNDTSLIQDTNQEVMDVLFSNEDHSSRKRDERIIEQLKRLG